MSACVRVCVRARIAVGARVAGPAGASPSTALHQNMVVKTVVTTVVKIVAKIVVKTVVKMVAKIVVKIVITVVIKIVFKTVVTVVVKMVKK